MSNYATDSPSPFPCPGRPPFAELRLLPQVRSSHRQTHQPWGRRTARYWWSWRECPHRHQSPLYSLPPLIRFHCRRCSCRQMGAWPEILYAWWCHHCGWGLVCPRFHLARSNWRVIWALVAGWLAWRLLCLLQETGWRGKGFEWRNVLECQ